MGKSRSTACPPSLPFQTGPPTVPPPTSFLSPSLQHPLQGLPNSHHLRQLSTESPLTPGVPNRAGFPAGLWKNSL